MSNDLDSNSIKVKLYLQTLDAQKRIQDLRHRVRLEATLPIGGVRDLFKFSENQLRGWENLGLLQPKRQTNGGQRRYPFTELDKLAIIRVLLDAGYSPGEIPKNIVALWKSAVAERRQGKYEPERVSIDERISNYEDEVFWSDFIPRILRLLLTLICEENSISTIGIIIPLGTSSAGKVNIDRTEDLIEIGESLVCWLNEKSLCYTAIEASPSFRYPTEFMVQQLQIANNTAPSFLVLPRGRRQFQLKSSTRELIKPFLLLLKNHIEDWYPFFTEGAIGSFDLIKDTGQPQHVLANLTELIVELGGMMSDGTSRWRFSCISLPDATQTELQRSITVQAQSRLGPHDVGKTTLSPNLDNLVRSASLQALQSGYVIYRPIIGDEDPIAFKRQAEGDVHSALAMPIGTESGSTLAVLYVASDHESAFSSNAQCLLRIMGRVIEEVIATYHIRQQVNTKLVELVNKPLVVDSSFRELASSNDFIQEVEQLLKKIEDKNADLQEEVSFVAIEVENASDIASKYGDAILKNLTRAVYNRINTYIRPFITRGRTTFKAFYVYGSRFYVILYEMSPEQTANALRYLSESLRNSYHVGIQRDLIGQASQPIMTEIIVNIGVTSFSQKMLHNKVLHDFSRSKDPIVEARAKINLGLDTALKFGKENGGNQIIQWKYESGDFKVWKSDLARGENDCTPG